MLPLIVSFVSVAQPSDSLLPTPLYDPNKYIYLLSLFGGCYSHDIITFVLLISIFRPICINVLLNSFSNRSSSFVAVNILIL